LAVVPQFTGKADNRIDNRLLHYTSLVRSEAIQTFRHAAHGGNNHQSMRVKDR
jgi:hypothetical protein